MPELPRGVMSRLGSAITAPFRAIRRHPVVSGLALTVIAAGTAFAFWPGAAPAESPAPQTAVRGAATGDPGALQKGTPDYPTLLPAGKSIEELGGWTRISPPDRNAVYAYVDTIGSIRISVSQQPLPADHRKDTARKVAELAQGYHAGQQFKTGEQTVHIGTSTQGPQSLIFSRDDLLVLIKSVAPLSNDQWATYISSLR